MPQLEIIYPDKKKSTLELQPADYILGRDPTATIPLVDRKVSRHHAKISFRNNCYWIEDLGSANGVVIDTVLINSPTRLTGKMDIEIGNFHLHFIPDGGDVKPVFQLVGLNRAAARQVYGLPLGESTVGRVDGNTIVINDKSISRFHVKITITEQSVTVEDLGSSNGTFIDRQQINGPTPLAIGQRLRIGSVELLFQPFGGMKKVSLKETIQAIDRLYLAAIIVALATFFMLVLILTVTLAGRSSKPQLEYSVLSQIEQEIHNKMDQGAKYQAQANWDQASATFQNILNIDPLNKEADKRLKTTLAELGYSQNLSQAQQLLKRDDAKTAQELLLGIPATSYYFDNARRALMEANTKLAELYYSQAYKMSRKNRPDYKAIHDKLIEHLTLDPTSDKGKKLVIEVEDHLQSNGIEFISYQQQLEAIAGKSNKLVTQEVRNALQQSYGNDEMVKLLVAYIQGDPERTKADLNNVVGTNAAKAKDLLAQINEMQRLINDGQGAKMDGNSAQALNSWERALKIEATFLPEGINSKTIRNLKHTMGQELYAIGEQHFKKQSYTDAFDSWYRGYQLDKNNTDIMGGFNKLNAVAKTKFNEAQKLSAPASCENYKLVINITMPDNQYHQKAQEKAANCK